MSAAIFPPFTPISPVAPGATVPNASSLTPTAPGASVPVGGAGLHGYIVSGATSPATACRLIPVGEVGGGVSLASSRDAAFGLTPTRNGIHFRAFRDTEGIENPWTFQRLTVSGGVITATSTWLDPAGDWPTPDLATFAPQAPATGVTVFTAAMVADPDDPIFPDASALSPTAPGASIANAAALTPTAPGASIENGATLSPTAPGASIANAAALSPVAPGASFPNASALTPTAPSPIL